MKGLDDVKVLIATAAVVFVRWQAGQSSQSVTCFELAVYRRECQMPSWAPFSHTLWPVTYGVAL